MPGLASCAKSIQYEERNDVRVDSWQNVLLPHNAGTLVLRS